MQDNDSSQAHIDEKVLTGSDCSSFFDNCWTAGPCWSWCGYVKGRREGRYVYYSIADERVLQILKLGESLLADNYEHVEACEITGEC